MEGERTLAGRKPWSVPYIPALNQVEGNARQGKTRAARHGMVRGESEKGGYQKTVVCPLLLCLAGNPDLFPQRLILPGAAKKTATRRWPF